MNRVLTKREIAEAAVLIRPICGVYLLCGFNGRLLYVGQSVDVQARVQYHRSQKRITFEKVVVIPCAAKDRKRIEALYISSHNPPLNRRREGFNLYKED